MKKETAEKILNETELGYDLISNKFSQTRKHFWRGLEFISNYTHDGDKIFDFGCGNGRLLELFEKKSIQYFGADVSQKLIDYANGAYAKENVTFSKLNPNQTSLAFQNGFFNTIYSIAVFHHFPSRKYRQDVALELFKKTHENGHIIVTVWYLWQQRYFKNIMQNWLAKVRGESALDWNDCEISFTDNQGIKFQRFHHAFTKRELKKLFKNAGFKIEKCEVIDGRNILLIGKKLQML
jgi:2-polyprenyl-3-methyl-5-hydroxy-6-metoxy-1,4-benzoquinol methylase